MLCRCASQYAPVLIFQGVNNLAKDCVHVCIEIKDSLELFIRHHSENSARGEQMLIKIALWGYF